MTVDFCVEALEEALRQHGRPEIFNTDQGAQFTSPDFTGVLKREGITISMDGKGRATDNIFIERVWRSLKYEDVYLHDYATLPIGSSTASVEVRVGGVAGKARRGQAIAGQAGWPGSGVGAVEANGGRERGELEVDVGAVVVGLRGRQGSGSES
jgi:putative transposase